MARTLFPVSQIFSDSSSLEGPLHLHRKLINYAVVDAFTDTPFKGNPAAVCLLPARQDSHWMQQVASEFNLSQTAFLVKRLAALTEEPCILDDYEDQANVLEDCDGFGTRVEAEDFDIRWFTPSSEVDLCGHATLASAYLLFVSGIATKNVVRFHTRRSGILTARKIERTAEKGEEASPKKKQASERFWVELNFPVLSSVECDNSELAILSDTLKGTTVLSVRRTAGDDLLVELSSGEEVEAICPRIDEIKKCNARGLIVTGPASDLSDFDCISRFFAPKVGVDEDPVCGQAHCALAPIWAKKLGKETLTAYQASKRGGTLVLRVDPVENRVSIQGEAVLVMSGVLLNKF